MKNVTNDPKLLPRLAEYHVVLGLLFFGLGTGAKDLFPHSLGLQPGIQFPCAYFSSVLIPLGSLLALRGVLVQEYRRKSLLAYHLSGVFFTLMMMALYFGFYVMINKIATTLDSIPNVLPKFVANAGTLPTEKKRVLQAQYAYRLYGTIIPYRLDDLQVVYYIPNEDDKDFWRRQQRLNAQTLWTLALLKNTEIQFIYLFGLYAATFIATYLAGGIWLITKMPASQPSTPA